MRFTYTLSLKLETFLSQPKRPMGRNSFKVPLVPLSPTYGQDMGLKAFNQLVGFPRKFGSQENRFSI